MPPVHTSFSSLQARPALVKDPVYFQLCGLLRDLIRTDAFPAGARFLTERQVGERFGVSRVTANKALSHLVVEGWLEFRKGVGTFVRKEGLDYDLQSLMSFTCRARLLGMKPTTRVTQFLLRTAAEAGIAVQKELGVEPEEWLFFMERIRFANGTPMILERRHLVAACCPKLQRRQVKGSLYSVLTQTYGLPIVGADQSIRAMSLPAPEARALKVRAGSAALWVHAIGHADRPLWVEDTLYRGDSYEFHNHIGSTGQSRPAKGQWRALRGWSPRSAGSNTAPCDPRRSLRLRIHL